METKTLLIALLLFGFWPVYSQNSENVGIGTTQPSEKLEVAGMIYTTTGGIKFPDQTVQTTAAYNPPGQNGSIPLGAGFLKFSSNNLNDGIDTTLYYSVNGNLEPEPLQNSSYFHNLSIQVSNPVFPGTGTPGTPSFSDVVFTKDYGKSTNALFKLLTLPTNPGPEVTFYLTYNNSENQPVVYFKIKLFNVFVTSLSSSHIPSAGGSSAGLQSYSLSYTKIEITDGATGNTYCYNLATNNQCQ